MIVLGDIGGIFCLKIFIGNCVFDMEELLIFEIGVFEGCGVDLDEDDVLVFEFGGY